MKSYHFARIRPIEPDDEVVVGTGFWSERLRVNREVSLAHAITEFEAAGNLENLRIAGGKSGRHRPTLTLDADIYKWLEAAAWELGHDRDPSLADSFFEVMGIVLAAQREDGYINSWFQVVEPERVLQDLTRGCEMYCAGHLIEAAVIATRTTGDPAFLDAATRFADLLDQELGPAASRTGVDGHEEIELALVALYRATGHERYLRLAEHLIDERGHGLVGPGVFGPRYYQDHEPVRDADDITGHAVRAMYLNAGATDVYLETGDSTLLQAMERQWQSMTSQKMYITGGLGSRDRDEAIGEPYELPPDRAYCETCAAAGLIFWSWRMLLATGRAEYANLLERTLYNAFLVGVGLDGASFFYANPLEVRSEHEAPHDSNWAGETPWYLSPAPEQASNHREPWFPCACCPPNVMRVLSSLAQYVTTKTPRGVQIHQYVPGSYRVALETGELIAFTILTEYPWRGDVRIRLADDQVSSRWSLSLRMPDWARSRTVRVNSQMIEADADYVRIERLWHAGDQIEVSFGLEPRLTRPPSRASALRGCIAIERGPLVYCIEEVDHDGVNLADIRIPNDASLTSAASDLLRGIVTVQARGYVVRDSGNSWPYRSGARETDAAVDKVVKDLDVRAIPYCLWGNRNTGAMRVWIPTVSAAENGAI